MREWVRSYLYEVRFVWWCIVPGYLGCEEKIKCCVMGEGALPACRTRTRHHHRLLASCSPTVARKASLPLLSKPTTPPTSLHQHTKKYVSEYITPLPLILFPFYFFLFRTKIEVIYVRYFHSQDVCHVRRGK